MNKNNKLPNDFNWKTYINLNNDLSIFNTEKEAIEHYINYGLNENRKYKKENIIILYDLMKIKKINEKDNIFYILSEIIKNNTKNISNNFIDWSFYKKQKLVFPDINYNKYKTRDSSNSCMLIEKEENKNNKKKIFLNDNFNNFNNFNNFINFLNIYNSFIVIFDLPENYYGGAKFFINTIIEKYKNKQNFLILYTKENNFVSINVNNKYYFNLGYSENSIKNILEKIQAKIKKIFINHAYGFSEGLINFLFGLNKKISTITHDHNLFNNNKNQLMYHEINEDIYKNNSFKYDFNLFEHIITQNKKNLYLFKNMTHLENIVVSELPDFKLNDEIIITNNKETVIGLIGHMSTIKGSDFIKYLIKIFEKTNTKIVIFGKMNDSNYKHCHEYDNIHELNDLLITYKPNMLLECSLWPETYSYTLSLAMLTELPILILKKMFPSVIDNRIKHYKNKFYFNNISECLLLIDGNKQNYFKTIKPIIYYNKFWDEYFTPKSYDYKFYIENNKSKIDEVSGKNIVLITSKIYVSNNKFSYSKKRSVYSSKQRFDQTLKTISSLKENIPDCFIVLFDNSIFTEEEITILNDSVNCFINVTNNKILNYYTDICEYKYLSDLYQQVNSYYYFLKYIDDTKINNFFKISGRYYLNNDFDYNSIYNNDLNIFKKNTNVTDRDYYYTCFFKISNSFFSDYFLKLIEIFENKGQYFDLDLEVIYGKCFLKQMSLVDNLGITQLIAVLSEITDI